MTHGRNWRIMEDGPGDAAWNMAVDEAVAESCRKRLSPPTFRFYHWKGPALTVGYFQNTARDLDGSACREKRIAVIRRMTGGRAVLHGDDLTYSVACGNNTAELPDTIQGAFFAISRGFIDGLCRLGLEAEAVQAPLKKAGRSPICFASTSRYEVTCSGRKILGSAQRRWRDGMLQQGSLLLRFNAESFYGLFRFPDDSRRQRAIEEARNTIIGLNDLLPSPLDLKTVSNQVAAGFERAMGISLKPAELTPIELERAYQLAETKYSHESWNRTLNI